MAAKDNLVPHVITDVNGKTTTVYRKAMIASTSKFVPLFPPVVAALRSELRVKLSGTISDLVGLDEERDISALNKTLHGYSSAFLEKLEAELEGDDENFVTSLAARVFSEHDEEHLNECIAFARDVGTTDMGHAFTLIKSLKRYERFSGYKDLSVAPEDVQRDCVALMGVTLLLVEQDVDYASRAFEYWDDIENNFGAAPIIVDEELIGIALESEESLETLRRVITEHHTADPNTIKGIIGGISPSIAEGAL